MSNFFIKKILQTNLKNIPVTDDTVLSITNQGNLYINTKQGENLKITDIIFIDTKDDFENILKTNDVKFDKIYIAKDTYAMYTPVIINEHGAQITKFISIGVNKEILDKIEKSDSKFNDIFESIKKITTKRFVNTVFHISNKLNMSELNNYVYVEDIKRNIDDVCKINNIQILTKNELTKDIKLALYINDEKITDIPMLSGTKENIIRLSDTTKAFSTGIMQLKVDDAGNNPDNVHIIVNVVVENINK